MSNSGMYINPASKNIINRPEYTLDKTKDLTPIFLGEVIDIDLESKAIKFRSRHSEEISLEEIESGAIPLLPNISHVPIRGEMVLIFYFGKIAYYVSVNYKNSTVSNQVPFKYAPNGTPGQESDYNKTYTSNKTFNVEGKGILNSNINEGDIVFEGRFGQAIKFGSTVKYQNAPQTNYSKSDISENGDPIVVIRNGVKSTDEDVKKDDSSIYLCSSQKIELDTNENGLEACSASWSTINVNNQLVQVELEPEDSGEDVHNEQSTTPAPVVPAPDEKPPVATPVATLPVESNTKVLAMLIGEHESNNMYDRIVNTRNTDIVRDPSILTMTITQIDKSRYGRTPNRPSGTSIGRYQIQSATALDVCKSNKINPDTFKFDVAGQDRLYELLLNRRGKKKYLAGQLSEKDFAKNVAHEWASMPEDERGLSAYGGNNQARCSWNTFISAIRSLKRNTQATPATSTSVAPKPPANTPPPSPPPSQPGYTGVADVNVSNLPKLPKKYQRYRQGKPFGDPVDIYIVDGCPVTIEVAEVFSKMKKDAWEQNKVTLKLNSGFRDNEDIVLPNGSRLKGQVTLWNELGRDPSVVARPGRSNHQTGIAMDIETENNRKAYKWLVRNALKYGVIRGVPKETWHWEINKQANTAFFKVPKSHPTWYGLTDGVV